jgi:hypothetical protein
MLLLSSNLFVNKLGNFFVNKFKRGNNKLSNWAKYLGIGLIVFVVLEFLLTEVKSFLIIL